MGSRLILALVLALAACSDRSASPGVSAGTASSAGVDAAATAHASADAAVVAVPVDATPAPGDTLLITPAPARAGTSSTITFDAELDFDLNFGGLETVTSAVQSKKKKVEVLSVDADGTVHKRITYAKRTTRTMVDGEPKKDRNAAKGKTFRVTWKDGVVIDVRRKNGAKATPEEVDAVKAEEVQLQAPELLGQGLAGLPLVKDQPFEVPASVMSKLVSSDFKPRRVVITYRGMDGDLAILDAEAALVSDDEALRMYVDLTGTMRVDGTGYCVRAEVAAQVRAEFGGAVVGSGKGDGTITATVPK